MSGISGAGSLMRNVGPLATLRKFDHATLTQNSSLQAMPRFVPGP